MGVIDRLLGRESRSLENPTIAISASADEIMAFFGQVDRNVQLPPVTIESALEVPAVWAAVGFASRMLASIPLPTYKKGPNGQSVRQDGALQMLLNEAPNPEWTSFGWRQYMWQQVFTGGRGCTWIERQGSKPVALWPMDPSRTTVARIGGRKVYRFDGREYPAADVIDVVFALRTDQLGVYGPIAKGRKAIGLAIAMAEFAGTFFAGGGVPPMALEGPLPQGIDAFKRATADIQRAIDMAKKAGRSFFGMPPGHSLKAIGIDPDKGQMTEARLYQLQEIARLYSLPPVFLQDLSKGTMANTEQQDLQLVKHFVTHWAKAFEDELNLKLFGQRRRSQWVEHNLDGLQRGDFKSRIEGFARAITTGQIMPDEARAMENRPPDPSGAGSRLYVQGATVPLGTVLAGPNATPAPNDAGTDADQEKTDDVDQPPA